MGADGAPSEVRLARSTATLVRIGILNLRKDARCDLCTCILNDSLDGRNGSSSVNSESDGARGQEVEVGGDGAGKVM